MTLRSVLRLALAALLTAAACAGAQEKAASLDVKAATESLARQTVISMDRSFIAPKPSRVYDATRQFVVETKADGTITELPYVVIPILFQKDTADLLDDQSRANLGKLAELLKTDAFKAVKFEVEGHTCSDGSAEHNKALSDDRAAALLAELKAAGIEPARLTARGFGETAPAVANDTEAHKQQNRRVVVVRQP